MEVNRIKESQTTLERIHRAAKAEFLEKGYKDASLRNIVKSVGMTTGAFTVTIKAKKNSLKPLLVSITNIFSTVL